MAHQSIASVGSAALDVIEDPGIAVEVGVTSGGQVASLRGRSAPKTVATRRHKMLWSETVLRR